MRLYRVDGANLRGPETFDVLSRILAFVAECIAPRCQRIRRLCFVFGLGSELRLSLRMPYPICFAQIHRHGVDKVELRIPHTNDMCPFLASLSSVRKQEYWRGTIRRRERLTAHSALAEVLHGSRSSPGRHRHLPNRVPVRRPIDTEQGGQRHLGSDGVWHCGCENFGRGSHINPVQLTFRILTSSSFYSSDKSASHAHYHCNVFCPKCRTPRLACAPSRIFAPKELTISRFNTPRR